jgi:multidrug transporter EmrE-like cation transporter
MQSWVLLFSALLMNSLANVLIKIGAKFPAAPDVNSNFVQKFFIFLNLPTILAMVFFALNIFVYRKALEGIQLSVAYPIMAGGGLFLVTLVSFMHPLLREKTNFIHIIGLVFIMLGIILVTREV